MVSLTKSRRFGQRVCRVIVRICPDAPRRIVALSTSIPPNLSAASRSRRLILIYSPPLIAERERLAALGRELERFQDTRVDRESVRSAPHLEPFQD